MFWADDPEEVDDDGDYLDISAGPNCVECGSYVGFHHGVRPRKFCPDIQGKKSPCKMRYNRVKYNKKIVGDDLTEKNKKAWAAIKSDPSRLAKNNIKKTQYYRRRDRAKYANRPGVAAKRMAMFRAAIPEYLGTINRDDAIAELAMLYTDGWVFEDAVKEAIKRIKKAARIQAFESYDITKATWL